MKLLEAGMYGWEETSLFARTELLTKNLRSRRMNAVVGKAVAVEPLEQRKLLSATLSTLVNFKNDTNGPPFAGVIADAAGNLYGTTGGSASGDGTVFKIAAGTSTLTTLATFTDTSGGASEAPLIIDASGNLYGTTGGGGSAGDGVVFKLAAGAHTITVLANFSGANGNGPQAGLLADAAGNLYGTTGQGGSNDHGTVFKVAAGTNKLTTLANFNGTNGDFPNTALIADAAGNLYGTTPGGGSKGEGTIFKVAAGTNKLTTLVNFNGTNGDTPVTLVADAAGNLYGMTGFGGSTNFGTVFKVAAGTNTFSTLVNFGTIAFPQALIADAAGNLYGTTQLGGSNSDGTVFKVAVGAHALSTLASFSTANGSHPNAAGGLTADAAGNLYGTMSQGGSNSLGTVFKVAGTGFVVPIAAKITVTAPAAQTASAGVAKSFTLGSFTAAGATAPYAVDVNWGDGTSDTKFSLAGAGTITAQPHTFGKAAADTVSVTVTDAKGHKSNIATFKVTAVNIASISGTVFNDANANQKFDATELGLSGWQVYIDANKDGKFDTGDTLATTDINGQFSFKSLAAGAYVVRIVQVAKTKTTNTGGAVQTITLAAGKAVTGVLFGEERIA